MITILLRFVSYIMGAYFLFHHKTKELSYFYHGQNNNCVTSHLKIPDTIVINWQRSDTISMIPNCIYFTETDLLFSSSM